MVGDVALEKDPRFAFFFPPPLAHVALGQLLNL